MILSPPLLAPYAVGEFLGAKIYRRACIVDSPSEKTNPSYDVEERLTAARGGSGKAEGFLGGQEGRMDFGRNKIFFQETLKKEVPSSGFPQALIKSDCQK